MSDQRLSDAEVSAEEKTTVPHEHDEKLAVEHDEKHALDSEAGHGRQAVALNLVENPLKVSHAESPVSGLYSPLS